MYSGAVKTMKPEALRLFLEGMYDRFNRGEYVPPDPLEVVREYGEARDREIAALVASALAVGRAGLIVGAVREVMNRMDGSPRAVLDGADRCGLENRLSGFRYRFFSGSDLAALLFGAGALLREYGSLGAAFSAFFRDSMAHAAAEPVGKPITVAPALGRFVREIRERAGGAGDFAPAPDALAGETARGVPFAKNLLPAPSGGSACKRPFLMLRWLVRKDGVDPGGWDPALAPFLVQPMDTHMSWVARRLGFIGEGAPVNLATALEVTGRFRAISPDDPLRYDFALTRPGIRPDLDRSDWFR